MMDIIKSTVDNPGSATYDGKDSNEQILHIYRQAFITNFKWLLMLAAFIVLPFLFDSIIVKTNTGIFAYVPSSVILIINLLWIHFVVGFALINYLNWFFNIYMITTKKIIDMDFEGLLYKNISETTLGNVEDVTSNISGAFGTVFNIGSVLIQTAGEKKEFEFINIFKPSKVRDIISDLVSQYGGGGRHNA